MNVQKFHHIQDGWTEFPLPFVKRAEGQGEGFRVLRYVGEFLRGYIAQA